MSAAEQLVLEIRRRHVSTREERCPCCRGRCQICHATWPCDTIRAADVIEALLARAGEMEGS